MSVLHAGFVDKIAVTLASNFVVTSGESDLYRTYKKLLSKKYKYDGETNIEINGLGAIGDYFSSIYEDGQVVLTYGAGFALFGEVNSLGVLYYVPSTATPLPKKPTADGL